MNIIVFPSKREDYYFRPDTTLEKESKDYYRPDGFCGFSFATCIYIKITKAGKCVSSKFASRYYNSLGAGILIDAKEVSLGMATSLDNSTILASADINFNQDNQICYEWLENDSKVCELYCEISDIRLEIDKKIEMVSKNCSLRIGDIVVFEVENLQVNEDSPQYKLKKGNQILLNFKVC